MADFTVISTYPKHASQNVGDALIEHCTKKLITSVTGASEFLTLQRDDNIVDRLTDINQTRGLIFAGLGVRPNMVPGVYRLDFDLSKIKVPIIAVASGTKLPSSGFLFDPSGKRAKIDKPTAKFLRKLWRHCEGVGCRGQVTYEFMRKLIHVPEHEDDKLVMTGDAAFFEPRFDALKFAPVGTVRRIAVSAPSSSKWRSHLISLLDTLRSIFPKAELTILQHGVTPWLNEADIGCRIDPIYERGVEAIDVYSDFDIHVGYRVHGHVSALKRRIPSYLIVIDGRGYDYLRTLNVGRAFRGWKYRPHPRKLVTTQPNLATIKVLGEQLQEDDTREFEPFIGGERELLDSAERLTAFVSRFTRNLSSTAA